jgi:transcriptional regulator with XRE-family HTH domain
MNIAASDLNQRIAARVRELRASRGVSLEMLAEKCGVSRSMLSLIERGESSPTAVVLEKIAAGLGVVLAALFELPADDQAPAGPLVTYKHQPVWQDPASGYLRRSVSPPGMLLPLRIVEVQFPPRKRVVFETSLREQRVHQQIWVLEGTMEITVDEERYRLHTGDCLAMQVGNNMMYYNPTRKTARYVVISTT